MSFPKYPEYKDSSVEWLGEVPAHWELKRLSHYFVERREKASDTEFAPLSVTKQGIVPRLETAAKTQDGDNRKKVCAGDFVINSRSDRKGSAGVATVDGTVSLICIVLEPRDVERGFIHHLLRSVPFQEEFYRNGRGIVADLWSTGFAEMKNIVLAIPPRLEQEVIAAFLEHETAKIDALVDEQKRLIELLKEKRQAVISHAVTKGLDPNVPMKDSGVEWLGVVPAHWEVVPLGLLAERIQTGPFGSQLHSHEYVDGQTPVINPSNIKDGTIIPDAASTVDEGTLARLAHQQLRAGDVIFGRRGEMGRCAVVREAEDGWLCGTGCMKLVCGSRISPGFVALYFQTPMVREVLELESVGSTMDNLNPEILSRIKIPVPPVSEQQEIFEFIRKHSEQAHQLLEEANSAVALLQERRSSLISAAVTGKIDVRGWRPTGRPDVKNKKEAREIA